MTSLEQLLFVGTHGHVRAVFKDSGESAWTTSLPSSGYEIVTLLFEDERLFAGSNGRLFCLDPATGEILWSDTLKGLGYDYMSLLTVRSAPSAQAAFAAAAAAQARRTSSADD